MKINIQKPLNNNIQNAIIRVSRTKGIDTMSNIQNAVTALHKAYNYLNKALFAGELPPVALTIQTRGKRLANGWFTYDPIWQDKKQKIQMHEINISAESLNRPYQEIMRTLLHEMVHLYCHQNGIKETSRNGTFHNKRFKDECEKHGLYYDEPADKKYGWAFPKLTPDTVILIEGFDIDRKSFLIARVDETPSKATKKANSFKWVCPSCEDTVRSTKADVKLVCGNCSDFESGGDVVSFELEE